MPQFHLFGFNSQAVLAQLESVWKLISQRICLLRWVSNFTLNQKVLYEKLPKFCTHCSLQGHEKVNCTRLNPIVIDGEKKKEIKQSKFKMQEAEVTKFNKVNKTKVVSKNSMNELVDVVETLIITENVVQDQRTAQEQVVVQGLVGQDVSEGEDEQVHVQETTKGYSSDGEMITPKKDGRAKTFIPLSMLLNYGLYLEYETMRGPDSLWVPRAFKVGSRSNMSMGMAMVQSSVRNEFNCRILAIKETMMMMPEEERFATLEFSQIEISRLRSKVIEKIISSSNCQRLINALEELTISVLLSSCKVLDGDETDPELQEDTTVIVLNILSHDKNIKAFANNPDVIPSVIKALDTRNAKTKTIKDGAVKVILKKVSDHGACIYEFWDVLRILSMYADAVKQIKCFDGVRVLLNGLRGSTDKAIVENCITTLDRICSNDSKKLMEIYEEEKTYRTLSRAVHNGTPVSRKAANSILAQIYKAKQRL
ncbi:hypothetical protein GIB67_020021 [Kingdonia uniflora]|uniref:Uncharacterized protein n=1 Tax=Kingdonia uniflora TaxID=39325 RepID=A0A7J7N492_9MAGN|nr:hypothetical protein GIB67_020021 [Kingdonia uniflora]